MTGNMCKSSQYAVLVGYVVSCHVKHKVELLRLLVSRQDDVSGL
jgi:hypothetical protein